MTQPVYYSVTHLTLYQYSEPITDSVMEIRMQPRSDGNQRCVRFELEISPESRVIDFRDYLGNNISTFDIPAPHKRLAIKADAVVEVRPLPVLPDSLPAVIWDRIDVAVQEDRELYDMLLPGHYARPTALLNRFSQELSWSRRADPLTLLRELNSAIYRSFTYNQHVTRVDSPIDIALENRQGVCQDFTHIMLALCRSIGIPARYVSGYLYHRRDDQLERSVQDASHAWVEAWLPDLGWIGFDPTNNRLAAERHIRVSVANDYADASPSRGVFKGKADTALEVRVKVQMLDDLPLEDTVLAPEIVMPRYDISTMQQIQQQQ
jgi:transglutaminase-like putative cysteine protease